MKLSEQIETLRAAQGDALRLATVDVELAYGDAPEERRAALRELLTAAAVPHWFDAVVLGALVGPDRPPGGPAGPDVESLLSELERLRCIERFAGRGSSARSVHQATRRALRLALSESQPARLVELSARAAAHFAGETSIAGQIEHVYHLLVADAERGAALCGEIGERWSLEAPPQHQRALALALDELLSTGLLKGRARGVAQLHVLGDRLSRGEAADLAGPAAETRALLESSPDPLDFVRAVDLQGQVAFELGDTEAAVGFYRETLSRLEAMVRADAAGASDAAPDATAARRLHLLAVSHTRLGDVEQWSAPDSARAHFESAVRALEALDERGALSTAMERELAVARARLSDVLREIPGQIEAALELQRRALATVETLSERDPDNGNLQRDLALQHARAADFDARAGRLEAALASRERAIAIVRRMVQSDASHLRWQGDLAQFQCSLGEVLRQLERRDAAEVALRDALTLYRHLSALQPGTMEWANGVRAALFVLAELAREQGRDGSAVEHLQAVLDEIGRYLERHPDDALWQRERAVAFNRLGQVRQALGDTAGAQQAYAEAVRRMQAALAHQPPGSAWQQDLENLRAWLSA